MVRELILAGAVLMMLGGLALVGIGWRARRSAGWSMVWAGAMSVAWSTVILIPENAVAVQYVAGSAAAVFLLALFVSMKREWHRGLGIEVLFGGVALGALAAVELLAPPPELEKVLLLTLGLAMTAFVVASSVKILKALRIRAEGRH